MVTHMDAVPPGWQQLVGEILVPQCKEQVRSAVSAAREAVTAMEAAVAGAGTAEAAQAAAAQASVQAHMVAASFDAAWVRLGQQRAAATG